MPLIIILAIIGVMSYYFGFFTGIVYFVEFLVLMFGITFLMRKYESKHGEIAPDEEVKERAKKVKLMEAKPLSFFEKASFITVLAITLLSAHYFGIWTAIKSLFIFISIIGYFLLLWDYVLVYYKKPKEIFPSQKLNYELPEFDFAELINKCREQPEKFIEEWKHKPIIVTGFACDIGRIDNSGYLINKLGHITKDFFGSKYEGMPAITIMDSYFGNSNETLGKFILNVPEAESLKINEMDKVKIQIFISELLLGYKESEISPKAIKYTSVTGIMEEEKLTQKEDHVFIKRRKFYGTKEIFPSQEVNDELPEFDFVELIKECKDEPEKFIEEWKHKPIIVIGVVKEVGKEEEMNVIKMKEEKLFYNINAVAEFQLNIPEAKKIQIKEGDRVKIQVFISELLLGYKADKISTEALQYISVTGVMKEEKQTQKEDHVFIKHKKFYDERTKEIFPSQEVNDELPEFDFVELIKECKDEPEKFIEEWKHKPIIVIGVVKEVGKEEEMNVIKMEGEKLFDNINAVAKFQLNIPKAQNFQIKEGDRVKIQVFISEIYLSYNYNKITYISVKGAMEEIKDEESNFLMVLPDEFQSIPTDSLRNFQVSYINNDTYKKSSIMLGIGAYDEVRHSHNYRFRFDSYLDSKLLKELYNIAYQREITIKGKRLHGVIFGNSFYHCEILIE